MDVVRSMSDIVREEVSSPRRVIRSYDIILRILVLAFTLVAAMIGGLNNETRTIFVSLIETLPPLHIPVTVKWHYLSAFVYFVASNAIASGYAATSLTLSTMITKSSRKNGSENGNRNVNVNVNVNVALGVFIVDLIMVALLFSANGAVIAVGLIGINGNSHVNWNKVCNVFEGFCRHSTAAVVMSMLGSFIFLSLLLLSTLNLHKKSSN